MRLVLIIIGLVISLSMNAQKTPWELRLGYEQMYVSSKMTDGIAEKTWIWTDGLRGDELFAMRTSLTHAIDLGIAYHITKWWDINLNYKDFYRRYYVWSGTYISKNIEGDDVYDPGRFNMVPYEYGWFSLPSMFLGRTLSVKSWQIGTDFHHNISKDGKWKLHYYLSFNRDKYKNELHYFDLPVNYGDEGYYNDYYTNQRVDYEINGKLSLKGFNPWQIQYMHSTNIALALSRDLKNGMGLRFEFGLRNISWTRDLLLNENHWELKLQFEEFALNDLGEKEYIYESNVKHDFPLYIGGLYSNLSFTFRPFRSPRDRDNYISPGKKIKNFLNKAF